MARSNLRPREEKIFQSLAILGVVINFLSGSMDSVK